MFPSPNRIKCGNMCREFNSGNVRGIYGKYVIVRLLQWKCHRGIWTKYVIVIFHGCVLITEQMFDNKM